MEDLSFEEFFIMYLILFFVCVAKPNRNYGRRKRTEMQEDKYNHYSKVLNFTHELELTDEKSTT